MYTCVNCRSNNRLARCEGESSLMSSRRTGGAIVTVIVAVVTCAMLATTIAPPGASKQKAGAIATTADAQLAVVPQFAPPPADATVTQNIPVELSDAIERDLGITVAEYRDRSVAANLVDAVAESLTGAGMTVLGTAVDGAEGVIYVESADDALLVEAAGLRAEIGEPQLSEPGPDAPPLVAAADVYGGAPVLSEGVRCSLGANGVSVSTGIPQALIAGHCATVGQQTFSLVSMTVANGTPRNMGVLGQSVAGAFAFGAGRDSGLIEITGPGMAPRPAALTWGFGAGAPLASSPLAASDAGSPVVGAPVCKSGSTTGWTCGTITRVDLKNVPIGRVAPYDFVDLFETTACMQLGDSGGPAFTGSRLIGISSASSWGSNCVQDAGGNKRGMFFAYSTGEVRAERIPQTVMSGHPDWEPSMTVAAPVITRPAARAYAPGVPLIIGGIVPQGGARNSVELTVNGTDVYTATVSAGGAWSVSLPAYQTARLTIEAAASWGTRSMSPVAVRELISAFEVDTSVIARDSSGTLWLYPVPDGQFTERVALGSAWASDTRVIGAGDVNGDGYRDILALESNSVVRLHPGLSSGGLGVSQVVTGDWVGRTALFSPGDFSGDGTNDLLSRSTSGDLFLHSNNGDGTFASPRRIGNGWQGFDQLFGAGDFDGDGFTDVMARDASGRLWLYSGNGRGGWRGGTQIGWGWESFSSVFSPGDFNADGAPDVLARASNGGLWLYSGNGRGGWSGARQVGWGWNAFDSLTGFGGRVTYPFIQAAGAGDVNRDGARDVLARTASGELYRYLGNGAGGWLGASLVSGGWASSRILVGSGDLDKSGTDDLLSVDGDQLVFHAGDGVGGYLRGVVLGAGWSEMVSVFAVGDGNGDRMMDLVARDRAGGLWLYPGVSSLAWGDRTSIGSGWTGFSSLFPAGDFNSDGQPDMIARSSSGLLYLVAGLGGGSWGAPVQIGNGWQSMTSLHGPGDFNGDRYPDVVARDSAGNFILYMGNGAGSWLGSRAIGWGWQGFTWIG